MSNVNLNAVDLARDVLKQRGEKYGDPTPMYTMMANLWSAILQPKMKDWTFITPQEVLLMMDAMKTVRLLQNPEDYDSVLDKIGYTNLLGTIMEERADVNTSKG